MENKDNQILHWDATISLSRDQDWDDIAHYWVDFLSALCSNWIFQIEDSGEIPKGEKTNNPHIQATFRLQSRLRKKNLIEVIYEYLRENNISLLNDEHSIHCSPTIKFNQDRLNWRYCSKEEGRLSGPYSDPTFLSPFDFPELNRPWQLWLVNYLMEETDTREIINVICEDGGSGKTTFQKHWLIKYGTNSALLDFSGTVGQLVAAICNLGPKRHYFVNLPWSMPKKIKGPDPYKHLRDLAQAIESTCDGLLSTSYFGSGKTLCFKSPHVIVFSNFDMDGSVPGGLFAKDRLTKIHLYNEGNFIIRAGNGHTSKATMSACAELQKDHMSWFLMDKSRDIRDAIESRISVWIKAKFEPVVTGDKVAAERTWPDDSVSALDLQSIPHERLQNLFGPSWFDDQQVCKDKLSELSSTN